MTRVILQPWIPKDLDGNQMPGTPPKTAEEKAIDDLKNLFGILFDPNSTVTEHGRDKTWWESFKDIPGDVIKALEDDTPIGEILTDGEKLVKLTLNILEKLIEVFPKLVDFAQWIIDYIFGILNDPNLGQKIKIFGWLAVAAGIFWLAFPVILSKIL